MKHGESPETPFVETRAGERFFLNAVLTGPALLVLWPVFLRGVLRTLGVIHGPSPLLDPVPALAAQVGRYLAWLSVIPLWSCWKNLRMELPKHARWALYAFAAVHVGVIGWWLWVLTER